MTLMFWLLLVKIVWIDVLLSGDNAVVIAMACRELPQNKRLFGMLFGAGGAIFLRIVLTAAAALVLNVPYIKLFGGLALLYIAVKLLKPQEDEDADIHASTSLLSAVGVIVVADATMSIDNIVAIAAASGGSLLLLGLGLAISIPLIVTGAALIVRILDKLPVLVWAGAGLLGWIAGEMIFADGTIPNLLPMTDLKYAISMALFVILAGGLWRATLSSAEG